MYVRLLKYIANKYCGICVPNSAFEGADGTSLLAGNVWRALKTIPGMISVGTAYWGGNIDEVKSLNSRRPHGWENKKSGYDRQQEKDMNKADLLRYIIREVVVNLKRPKIIFLAGGPGSGKSTVVDALDLTGFEVVDPDKSYEEFLLQNNISLNVAKVENDYFDVKERMNTAVGAGDQEEIARLTPEYIKKRRLISIKGKGFIASQQAMKKRHRKIAGEKRDFIIDGTAGDFGAVSRLKLDLEKYGYDTAMIFVDAPLEVALQRNQVRGETGGRRLRDETVEKSWMAANKNLKRFEKLFGETFFYMWMPKT